VRDTRKSYYRYLLPSLFQTKLLNGQISKSTGCLYCVVFLKGNLVLLLPLGFVIGRKVRTNDLCMKIQKLTKTVF